MQKQIYFRIIELENHQGLLQKVHDEDDDTPALQFIFHVMGCCIKQTHGFSSEKKRDEAFDIFTDETAQKMIDSTLKLFEEDDTTI